jgi:hypothetical protein
VSDVLAAQTGKYAEDYVKAALANFCESTGDYVKRAAAARFRRVERGLYELLSILRRTSRAGLAMSGPP